MQLEMKEKPHIKSNGTRILAKKKPSRYASPGNIYRTAKSSESFIKVSTDVIFFSLRTSIEHSIYEDYSCS